MIGQNIVASAYLEKTDKTFKAIDPFTGTELEGDFSAATLEDVSAAMDAAAAAHLEYKSVKKDAKAAFLNAIAAEIETLGDTLIARAAAESGLTLPRLQGELKRTTGQLRLFAALVAEGSWVNAILSNNIRRMMIPLGPVVVFGASNFPMAFSVAGGDTASALAAGCPVVVKAHPAHPGTSALVGGAILAAAKKTNMPEGVFSMLFDDSYQIGSALVAHPKTKAVTFTGSYNGGMALVKIAQQRKEPIPVFAEMGSINPVFLLPEALATKAEEMATAYAASITLGAGQFCTNPGLLLAMKSPALDTFIGKLETVIAVVPSATMLTPGIYDNYEKRSEEALLQDEVSLISGSAALNNNAKNQALAKVAKVSAAAFLNNPKLHEEVFGPYSLLVIAEDLAELQKVTDALEGQLTITIMAAETELSDYTSLISALTDKAGRLILNGVPTGVEVCAAMQHGGPFPATNDSRFTSVGSTAVYRFVRPLAYQDWSNSMLPDELKDENPLNIFRSIDNKWTKD